MLWAIMFVCELGSSNLQETHLIRLLQLMASCFKERPDNKEDKKHSQQSRARHGEVVPCSFTFRLSFRETLW